jgi:hypothetical protein
VTREPGACPAATVRGTLDGCLRFPRSPAEPFEGAVVTRWEYATAPLISHALQQILNQWGADGWELVGVVNDVAYFKRPLDDG